MPTAPPTSAAELPASLKGSLASFKQPAADRVFFTSTPLPRGDTGKILRRQIRETLIAKLRAPKSRL